MASPSTRDQMTRLLLLTAITTLTLFSITVQATFRRSNESVYVTHKMSDECQASLNILMASVKKEEWALKVVDSFGKPEDSMLEGNLRWAGEYDQCRSIESTPEPIPGMPGFKGRYCWLSWTSFIFGDPVPFQSGGCLPNTCDEADTMAAFPYILNALQVDENTVAKSVTLDEVTCLADNNPLSASAFFTLFLLILFAAIVGTISFYDYWETILCESDEEEEDEHLLIVDVKDENLSKEGINGNIHKHERKQRNSDPGGCLKRVLMCFSAVRNATELTDSESGNKQMAFVNGLRVLCFYPILVIHAENCQLSIDREVMKHRDYAHTFSFQFVLTGHYSVETFFFLSGFFFANSFLKNGMVLQMTVKRFMALTTFRYLRTSVPMLVALVIQAVLMFYTNDGPMWDLQEYSSTKCSTIWWTFLFNIQNFFSDVRQCAGWLWYVAIDFQFFLAGLCLLFVFQRSMKTGVLACVALIVISSVITICICYSNNVSTFQGYLIWREFDPVVFQKELDVFTWNIYNMPYCRIGTFLVGLLYGIYHNRNSSTGKTKLEIGDVTIWFGWLFCCFCLVSVVLAGYYINFGAMGSAFFHAFGRYVWCAGLIWIFHVCLNGHGGLIQSFLANDFWTTLGRLTFSSYLIHMMWLQYLYYSERQFSDYSPVNMTMLELGSFAISYMFAFVFHLLFEAPFVNLGKMIFFPQSTQQQHKPKFVH